MLRSKTELQTSIQNPSSRTQLSSSSSISMGPTSTPTPKPLRSATTTTPHFKHHRSHSTPSKHNPSPLEHPVEVIARIRDHPGKKQNPISPFHISSHQCNIQLQTEIGYRDFTLDGVSLSAEEDLTGFYNKFIKSRISGVKLGEKCTIMMYGPTGAGKSHTMFGCSNQPGIVYRALKDILGDVSEGNQIDGIHTCFGLFVQVTVLEIYNEEIYDLLSNKTGGGGLGFGWPKGNASKVKLEVMGKKAKNATFLSGNEAGKISREVAKVEKRRIVKSTHCNERSSRSHCMIILDVPTVGGRLMLVDMAGSENIEQAGQVGFEAKMQTAKINQGNIALKRVVESIANGDSHVPFRDSKLTMLLQDSFEDDKSKILMILCASPDPKEIHKTISTLEYGAKAKCIVRGTHRTKEDKIGCVDAPSAVLLGSRIVAMDQFIVKLQTENRHREKERNEANKELLKKEEEVAALRAKLELMEKKLSVENVEEINSKVKEREHVLKLELERKLQEHQKMADEIAEMERRRMEEKILRQQEELELLRQQLEELESQLHHTRDNSESGEIEERQQSEVESQLDNTETGEIEESGFAKRLMELCANAGQDMVQSMDMVKSMDFDMGEQQTIVDIVKETDKDASQHRYYNSITPENPFRWTSTDVEEDVNILSPNVVEKVHLSTVFEEEEEVEKEVVEEPSVSIVRRFESAGPSFSFSTNSFVRVEKEVEEESAANIKREVEDEEVEKEVVEEPSASIMRGFEAAGPSFSFSTNSFVRVEKEVEEESAASFSFNTDSFNVSQNVHAQEVYYTGNSENAGYCNLELSEEKGVGLGSIEELKSTEDSSSDRTRTQNVPHLCENHGEHSEHVQISTSYTRKLEVPDVQSCTDFNSKGSPSHDSFETAEDTKENNRPNERSKDGYIEVYVKWEALKECPEKFITKLKVVKDSTLADLRKLVEIDLDNNSSKQGFTFLMLEDPTGAPVKKENEAIVKASELPIHNEKSKFYLACLRQSNSTQECNNIPFSSLENKLHLPNSRSFSPKAGSPLSPVRLLGNMLHC